MTKHLTAIRAARVFDGHKIQNHALVLIAGAKILDAGVNLAIPEGTQIIDCPDATVLPGFVDSHVHTVFDASDDPVATLGLRDDAEAFAAMASAARIAARGGVTTMRDLGDRGFLSLGLRDAARNDPTMPEMLVAGPPITTPGGHCHFLGCAASGVDGVRAAVRQRAERGADVVKIMASGGNMTPGSRPELSQFGLVELRAAVEEAHSHGLPIVAHAHGTQSIVDALQAGVDGLEHVTFMTADGVDEVPDAVVTALTSRPITLGMTLGVKPVPGIVAPPGLVARMAGIIANTQHLYQSGASMIAGTDAGIAPIKPADVIRWAPAQLSMIGMSPLEALHTCTAKAASVLGLGNRKGRIAPGYDADLLIVNGDPLTNPEALHQIHTVYIRGNPLQG